MELLKYVYWYAQKSIIKAGNNKFQDLINAPRIAAPHQLRRVRLGPTNLLLTVSRRFFCCGTYLFNLYLLELLVA